MIKTINRIIKDDFSLAEDLSREENITSKYESINISPQLPIVWDKAKDFSVYDEEGNKWIDLTSGIFAMNAGHSNTFVNDAIKKQLDSDLVFSFLYPTKIREELAKKLLEVSPNHFEKVVLLNTGSEATDIAYKMIKTWAKKNNKKYIVSFKGCYHGRVLSSDLISSGPENSDWSNVKDEDLVFLDFPYKPDDKFDPSLLPPGDQIAAYFIETYQGWGAWMYPDHYMREMYKFAKDNGSLVCFDEIQAGMYRMGTLYGYMTYGDYIKPDIICAAKALSAPLPLSAVLSSSELIDGITKVGGTNSGNPLCCASTIANIEFLTNKDFQKELKQKTVLFEKRLKKLEKFDIIDVVNVKGMVSGIIFHEKEDADKVVVDCVKNGVMVMNTWSTSIKIGPPLTITIDAINEALDVIEASIKNITE
jgi:4-aminobutyrate aminotransferase/(S)-3-amino-2-methylpropionate transaminase